MNSTLNFLATKLASRTSCRLMYTRQELATVNSVLGFGLILRKIFIHTRSTGTKRLSCEQIRDGLPENGFIFFSSVDCSLLLICVWLV